MESQRAMAPLLFVALFLLGSLLMLWRLEAMSARGFEGTVLGTLVMPYCSGLGNLVFAFLLARRHGPGAEVMTNALVNNVTNMTLILGLPALLWGVRLVPGRRSKSKNAVKTHELNRLALLFTLLAVLFFGGAVWALGRDGRLDFSDGLVLVGLFLFWQCYHVFDVLKSNVQQSRSFGWRLAVDAVLLALGAWAVYASTDWLVHWLEHQPSGRFLSARYLGWLSGWLMVLPNALLAFYYAWRGRPEITYTSQVGDGHVCIPLCVGIYALHHPLLLPGFFETGMMVLAGATLAHMFCVVALGGLPRFMGVVLLAGYAWFVKAGLGR
jgi:cation:H+ antiporter